MDLWLIRHAKTQGNLLGQYIGATDEPLCPEGAGQAKALHRCGVCPCVDAVVTSPMRRAIETAEILYPGQEARRVNGLRERSFGAFEGKTYALLKHNPVYQRWIASAGSSPIPQGEGQAEFEARVNASFAAVLGQLKADHVRRAAFVMHGGAVMVVMARFAAIRRDFYGFMLPNCGYYRLHAVWNAHDLSLEPF